MNEKDGRGYIEIVSLKDHEANEALTMIVCYMPTKALDFLKQWDQGEEGVEINMFIALPFGYKYYQQGMYTMIWNMYLAHVVLYKEIELDL